MTTLDNAFWDLQLFIIIATMECWWCFTLWINYNTESWPLLSHSGTITIPKSSPLLLHLKFWQQHLTLLRCKRNVEPCKLLLSMFSLSWLLIFRIWRPQYIYIYVVVFFCPAFSEFHLQLFVMCGQSASSVFGRRNMQSEECR